MIPLKNTSPFVEMFNELVDREVTEFEKARIRKELNKFALTGSYGQVQEYEGMYAALINDIPSMHQHFNAAIKHLGGDANTKFNYAVSLSNAFELIKSIEIADELVIHYCDDINVLQTLLDMYEGAFNWEMADSVLEKLIKLGCNDEDFIAEHRQSISLKREILQNNNLSWVDISTELSTIGRLIVSQNYRVRYITENVRPDIPNIFIEFALNTSVEELFRIDNLIVEHITSRPYAPIDSVVTFSCKTFE